MPRKSVIIGHQLRKARQFILLTPEEVATELNVHPQDIQNWEKELTNPNLKQLEKLAEIYGREINYFVRETPNLPEKIEFRGKTGHSLKELPKEAKIVLARFDELCRTAFEFENLLNKKIEVKLPQFIDTDTPAKVAENMRARFKVGDHPIKHLKNLLENEGVRIFELPVLGDSFSGISFLHEYGPCILLNYNDTPGRKNFTLAHELAHLLYRHLYNLCYIPPKPGEVDDIIESKVNRFAVEFLLPRSNLLEEFRVRNLSKTPSIKDLQLMANKWNVSLQALGYRLENLGVIDKGFIDSNYEQRPPFLRRSKTPKWEKQLGKRYVELTFEAYHKGLISIGKLAEGVDITVREAIEEIDKRSKK
ncbi:MAG: XRE family transcriptional regulator [bacterium]